jgi:hypothetical protein
MVWSAPCVLLETFPILLDKVVAMLASEVHSPTQQARANAVTVLKGRTRMHRASRSVQAVRILWLEVLLSFWLQLLLVIACVQSQRIMMGLVSAFNAPRDNYAIKRE